MMKKLIPILFILSLIFALSSCEDGSARLADSYYTVTFDTDGAIRAVPSQTVKSGTTAIEPKDPVKEYSMFKEWTLDGAKYDFSATVTKDITLKAQYYKLYTVIYDSDGGSYVSPQEVIEGSALLQPADPVKEGTGGFAKWVRVYDDGHTEYYDFSKEEAVTSDIVLKAVYAAGDETLTVKFDSNGGTTIPLQYVTSGNRAVEPREPEKKNTYFKCWAKVLPDGSVSENAFNFNEPLTEDTTLKAVYYTTYTITFWSMGGDSVQNDIQYVKEGDFIIEPRSPQNNTKWGFKSWMVENEDGSLSSFDFMHEKPTSNMTFVATYYEKYTVSFRSDDGKLYATQEVKEGEKAIEIAGPAKDGAWSFYKWYIDGYNTEYDFDLPVTEDLRLAATYIEGYKITFDSDGGDYTPEEQFVKENGTVTEPKTPDKAGTRGFMWWTKDGVPYDFSSEVTESFTLKAVYWPANLSLEDYSIYDNEMHVLTDEVRAIHFITKKLVNNDALMAGGTDFVSVFGNTDSDDSHNDADALLLKLFTNALISEDKVTIDGETYNTSELDTYQILSSDCAISSNTVDVNTISTGGKKYTFTITGLKIKIHFYKYEDPKSYEEDQTVEISLKGTVLRNSDERYEMHVQLEVNGKTYPVLHSAAFTSGDNGGDNVLAFTYNGFTRYVPGISLW